MKEKFALKVTLALFLSILLISTPILASENSPDALCSPWKYQHSYLECINGDTYMVDVYTRNCDGETETWRDYTFYVGGVCPEFSPDPEI